MNKVIVKYKSGAIREVWRSFYENNKDSMEIYVEDLSLETVDPEDILNMEVEEEPEEDTIEDLRAKLKALGIKYSPAAKIENLRKKLEEAYETDVPADVPEGS